MKVLAVLAALALAGCVSTGTQVKPEALTGFQKGVTTEADVERALGPPTSRSANFDRVILVYAGTHAQVNGATFIPIVGMFAGGATAHSSTVTMTFGPDGKLSDMTSTDTNVAAINH